MPASDSMRSIILDAEKSSGIAPKPKAPAAAPAKRGRTAPVEGQALADALREEQLKQALAEFSDRLLGKTPR